MKNKVLNGVPISSGIAIGKIRFINTFHDMHNIENGDIIVVKFSRPDYVLVFKKISGIVCINGGKMSHLAILAREFGIPGVFGVSDAFDALQENEMVKLNAYNGIIEKYQVEE